MSGGSSEGREGVGFLDRILGWLPEDWSSGLGRLSDVDTRGLDWLGDESSRVGHNLLQLLERGGSEILAHGGRLAVSALAGACVVAVLAGLAGLFLHLVAIGPLLRRGWRTGRVIGCFVASLTIVCAASGGGWAGLWLGAGRAIERAIEGHYLVERTAAAAYLAFTLDNMERAGDLDPEEVERLLAAAQESSANSWDAFISRAAAAAEARSAERPSWLAPDLLVGAVELLGGDEVPDLLTLHRVLTSPDSGEAQGPLAQTAGIRSRAIQLVRSGVYGQAAVSVGLGLGVPVSTFLLLGMIGWLVNRPGPDGAPSTNEPTVNETSDGADRQA